MPKRWNITGYDGPDVIYERSIPHGGLSEPEMTEILLRLQSRHLTSDEVVSSSLRKNAKGKESHLQVVKNQGGRWALMTTSSGVHYVATVEG